MKTGLRRLHYFLKLSEQLNYRQTARELGMTQPALSRAIAQLEDEIGFALFERTNRNVTITEAGSVFGGGCREALTLLNDSVARARKISNGQMGHLVLGYTEVAIAGRLARIVESFRKAYPEVEVELRAAWTEAQLEMLASGSIDVGFVTDPVARPEFANICVQSDSLVVIMPPTHPLTKFKTIPLPKLANEPFVTGSEDRWRVFHGHIHRICDEAGFRPNVVQTAPDTLSILGLVACGMGLTIQTDNPQTRTDSRVAVRPIANRQDQIRTLVAWNCAGTSTVGQTFVAHVESWIADQPV